MEEKVKLSSVEARTDLTDRECCKIIGGVLGSLNLMTDLESLRSAVRWWANTDEAWEGLEVQRRIIEDLAHDNR